MTVSDIQDSQSLMLFCDSDSRAEYGVAPRKFTIATLKAWVQNLIPASLRNPQPLTFTGGATGDYDGSAAKTVSIPKAPADVGAAAASHKHPKADITDFPANLPNEHALTFAGAATGSYDGAAPRQVYIPAPPPAHTGVALSYPAEVSVRNAALQRIAAQLLPAAAAQQAVLFLPAEGSAIALYPDGTFRAKQLGTSRVYVVPAHNGGAYREATITVRPALMRRTGGGALRMYGGKIRIC